MTLIQIFIFIFIALIIRLVSQGRGKSWLVMICSLILIYWLQPLSAIRSLEFWLPTILILLAVLVWGMISPREKFKEKENIFSFSIVLTIIVLVGLLRYLKLSFLSIWINPPEIRNILILLIPVTFIFWILSKANSEKKAYALPTICLLISIFVILKYQPITEILSYLLRKLNNQSLTLVNAQEIVWVGYSYFAFRLIHVLREWQQGRKIHVRLNVFITYLLFFPAFTAGPIDRLEHFFKEIDLEDVNPVKKDILQGGMRVVKGLFYKFILADSLALVVFNSASVQQINKPYWIWIIVYCYAFRIYFDFSGYTDLAIGISKIMGIQLPENFDRPYLSRNLSLFWNRWHMSLTQWFHTYYFNPVTRFLRTNKKKLSTGTIIFFTQITTMLLIGLWHGMSLNFIFWGLWNGLGLFAHNRWSEWMNKRNFHLIDGSWINRFSTVVSIFLTFNYAVLGWVWFAMPTINDSLSVFRKLLGGI